ATVSTDIPALATPSAGHHTLCAGDGAQGVCGAGPATGTLHVNQAATTAAISAPTITYNANGSVTVSMTSTAGTVTGNVSLSVDRSEERREGKERSSRTFRTTETTETTRRTASNNHS